MVRAFLFLVGFGMAVSGGVSMLAYLNLIPTGVNLIEFFIFISTRPECYLLPIGILLITASITIPNNEVTYRKKD